MDTTVSDYFTFEMNQDQYYYLKIDWSHFTSTAYLRLYWQHPTASNTIIPSTAFYYPEYVGSSPYQVSVS